LNLQEIVVVVYPWAPAEIFPGGQSRHFPHFFQVSDKAMQSKWTFTKRFTRPMLLQQ